MSNACKRDFYERQIVYLVDYWSSEAWSARGQILQVDKANNTFVAVLYGDTYQRYSFNDYGRLVFDTAEQAGNAANKLPREGDTLYQKIGKKVYKKISRGISGHNVDGTYDLVICLNKGGNVSIKEIGKSIFLNEADARENKK